MFKLGIVNRTIAGYIAMMLGVILLTGYSMFGLSNIIENEKFVDKANDRAVLELQAAYNFANAVGLYRSYMLYHEESHIRLYKENIATTKDLLRKNLEMDDETNKLPLETVLHMVEEYDAGINQVVSGQVNPLVAQDSLAPMASNIHRELQELSKANIAALEVASKQSVSQAVAVRSMNIGVSLLVLVVSGICVAMALRLRRPFKEVVDVAHVYAAGDFTKPINYTSQDELGEIAATLNSMSQNMREVIRNVMFSAEQVAASSEQLSASAEQTARAADQVAQSITTVAQGTEEEMRSLDRTMTVVDQLSAGVQQAATNANTVAAMSEKTARAAQEGGKAVEQAINKMADIEDTVNRSAVVVTELGARSKEIGQIVSTIAGIAGQTNLLALNAAIEAARAGEQGRGFAVVAEEVRKLAEQSQEAAKQIADLINTIQADTDKAVNAMNAGTHEVKEGAQVVDLAGVAFKEIITLVDQVTGQIREVSSTTQQIATGSQQIVTSIHEIDKVSRDIAAETQSVSAATEEQSASMEEIASSSEALAKLAQDLQEAVNRFKV